MWSSLTTLNDAISAPLNELLTRLLARDVLIVVTRPSGAHGGCVHCVQQFLRWLAVSGRMHPA